MFEKLEYYLIQWVPQARKETLMNALVLLDKFGHTAAWNEISDILESASDETTSAILDNTEMLLNKGMDIVLGEHSVRFIGELHQKNIILEGLLLVQNWSDPQTIFDMASSEANANEVFCNLISHVTGVPWQEFIDGIVYVSDGLISKVAQMYEASMEDVQTQTELPFGVSIERRKKIEGFLQEYPTTLANRAITENLRPLGVPIDIVFSEAKPALILLEPDAADRAALELTGIALISDIPDQSLMQRTKELTDLVYSDLRFITAVDVSIDQYMTKVLQNG